MGQRLTPQQYELINGMDADHEMRIKRQLDTNNEEFLAARHRARLSEEWAERIRRQKVLSQEWTEAESRASARPPSGGSLSALRATSSSTAGCKGHEDACC